MSEEKISSVFPAEVRERAVRLVRQHRGEHAFKWAAVRSIAEKIGWNPETLRNWLRQSQRDAGEREGMTTQIRERLRALERENPELRQANEIPDAAGIRDVRAKGFALGVASRATGTARAFQTSDTAAAFASLGMILNALLTILLVPIAPGLMAL